MNRTQRHALEPLESPYLLEESIYKVISSFQITPMSKRPFWPSWCNGQSGWNWENQFRNHSKMILAYGGTSYDGSGWGWHAFHSMYISSTVLRNNHWYYSLKIPCDISSRSDKEHWWKINFGAELQRNPCLIKVTEQTWVTHWMVSCSGFSFVRSGTVIIVPPLTL